MEAMANTHAGHRRAPPRRARRPAPAASHPSRRTLYIVAFGAAAIVAGVLIGISFSGSRSNSSPGGTSAVAGVSETAAMLNGIPQHGTALGSPGAPLKLVEYVDMQCPYCARWATEAFPTIVDRYVRTGKLQIEFRGLAFLGPDSVTALRTALAAADQNKLWNVVELLFRNQGVENSGWVTEDLLRRTLAGVPDLDGARVLAERGDPKIGNLLNAAAAQAKAGGITGTPSFQVSRHGGALQRLNVTSLDAKSFSSALRSLLRG